MHGAARGLHRDVWWCSLLAALHGPKRLGERIYAALIVLLSLTGVGVACAPYLDPAPAQRPGARLRPGPGLHAGNHADVQRAESS